MKESDFIEAKIRSPLTTRSSNLRKKLLLTSLVSITIYYTGLMPNKIDGLGIVFDNQHQKSFLTILICILAYYLIQFTLAGITDYYLTKLKRKEYLEEKMREDDFLDGDLNSVFNKLEEINAPLEVDKRILVSMTTYRVLLDIYLPLILSIFSIWIIVSLLMKL